MKGQLKDLAKKFKAPIIAYNVYDSWRIRRRFISGRIESFRYPTHKEKTLTESIEYINDVFEDYMRCPGISAEALRGKRILEIGQGDNLGVAMRFLAAGAAEVVCLDKFLSSRNPAQEYKIYRALRESLGNGERERFDKAINLDSGIAVDAERLRCIYGKGIEEADGLFEPESFDYIVSRAVLEYVYDIDAAFMAMDSLLRPGGYMMHKIDFRDHGIFIDCGMHPLTFLTIPEFIYRMMARDSGKSNRRLLDYYRNKTAELGYESRIWVTHTLKEAEVDSIRPHLISGFKDMPDKELMVSGIFLIAGKPAVCKTRDLVSVIIPTYNAAGYVAGAIDSLLAQSYKNFEIIVVDDGSTDSTAEVLKPYRDRITYIRKRNGGPASARNRGIEASKGEYIAFLDADDTALPEKLSLEVEFMRNNPDAGVVATNYTALWENGLYGPEEVVIWKGPCKENIFYRLLRGNFIPMSTPMIRRECLAKAGIFDESKELIGVEDYDFWLRLARYYKFGFLKDVTGEIRRRDDSLSADFEKTYRGDIVILEKTNRLFCELELKKRLSYKRGEARYHYLFGDNYFYVGRYGEARRELLNSLRCFPFSIRAVLFLLLSLLPANFIDTLRRARKRVRGVR